MPSCPSSPLAEREAHKTCVQEWEAALRDAGVPGRVRDELAPGTVRLTRPGATLPAEKEGRSTERTIDLLSPETCEAVGQDPASADYPTTIDMRARAASIAAADTRARAVEYASKFGLSVLPLIADGKRPPRGYTFERASNDPAAVEKMFSDALGGPAGYNIAIMTGDRLVAIDVDDKGDGVAANYNAMVAKHGEVIPPTVMAFTPGGGAHFDASHSQRAPTSQTA